MSSEMTLKIATYWELLVAYGTLERFLASVRPKMNTQLTSTPAFHAAYIALKGFIVCVG